MSALIVDSVQPAAVENEFLQKLDGAKVELTNSVNH